MVQVVMQQLCLMSAGRVEMRHSCSVALPLQAGSAGCRARLTSKLEIFVTHYICTTNIKIRNFAVRSELFL